MVKEKKSEEFPLISGVPQGSVQLYLNKIYSWERANNMKLNGEKFLVLRFRKDQEIKVNTIYFTGDMQDVITQVNHCRDLGIIMQDDATFNLQQEKVSRKERQKCGWILKTFFFQKPKFLKHIWTTLV